MEFANCFMICGEWFDDEWMQLWLMFLYGR